MRDDMTTWWAELRDAFAQSGDQLHTMETTLSDQELHDEFYAGYGLGEGVPFTAWGKKYVYFPVCYDGAQSVGWAPRNPCDEAMGHVGGG